MIVLTVRLVYRDTGFYGVSTEALTLRKQAFNDCAFSYVVQNHANEYNEVDNSATKFIL